MRSPQKLRWEVSDVGHLLELDLGFVFLLLDPGSVRRMLRTLAGPGNGGEGFGNGWRRESAWDVMF